MMIEPLTQDRGPVAFRLFVPATDTHALAEELRGACGGDSRVCGKVESIEKKGTYVVANVWHELSRDGIEQMPDELTLGSGRDRPWRQTAGFQAFQNTERAVALFTTASATAALGLLIEDQMWTAIEMSAYEFEDIAVVAGADGKGGFQLDVVQSYTERGERVAKAGVHARMMSGWEAFLHDDWRELYDRLFGGVKLDVRRKEAKNGRGPQVDLALNAGVDEVMSGSRAPDRRMTMQTDLATLATTVPEGPTERTREKLEDAKEHVEKYERRAERWSGTDRVERYRKYAERAKRRVGEIRERASAMRQGARNVLSHLSSLELTTRSDDKALRTHLHVGPGSSEPVEPSSEAAEPTALEGPPQCITDLARRVQQASGAMDFEDIPERFLDAPAAAFEGEAAETKAAQVTYMRARRPLEKLRESCTDLTGPQRVDVRRTVADFYREYGRVELKLWNLDDAAKRFARSCRLGAASVCEMARMVHGLEPPEADYIQAEATPGADYRVAGPTGVTTMEKMLFDWSELHELAAREVEITERTDESNQSDPADEKKGIEVKSRSIHSVIGGASDGAETSNESSVELEPPERYQYGHPLADLVDNRAEIGGGRFQSKTHATTLFADRGLPVRHLAAIVQHVEYGHPESDEGLVALLTRRRGGDTRHGWHLVSGVRAPESGATIRVTPAGYEIEVGGETLEPVEGCPSEGPTVCLDRPTKKVEAALTRHAEGYGEGDRDDDELEQLIEAYRVEALDEALSKAGDKADGAHPDRLQIVVDGRVPQAVITRVISTALFETKTTGERRRVVGGRFGEFYVATE